MSFPETAVRFGRSKNLIGVLARPAEPSPAGRPAVLLLSAGVVHSAGPFRMYVALARRLVEMGFVVLRFDLAGIGDSAQPRDARTVQERTVDDITDAMDYLARSLDVRTFVLGGLCSAADDAHALTNIDTRVVGNILIDGYAYPTPRYRARRVTAKFTGPSLIPRLLARASRSFPLNQDAISELPAPQHIPRPFPDGGLFRSEVRASLERGVQYLCVFSGGVDYYNYEGQFRDHVGVSAGEPALNEVYLPGAEHTFPLTVHRTRMVEVVSEWLDQRFGGHPAAP